MAYPRVPLKAAQSFLDEIPRIRRALAEIRVLMLIVYSAQDRCVPTYNSRHLARLVSDTELLELPGSRHLATVDLDADLPQERSIAFIDRVRAESATGTGR